MAETPDVPLKDDTISNFVPEKPEDAPVFEAKEIVIEAPAPSGDLKPAAGSTATLPAAGADSGPTELARQRERAENETARRLHAEAVAVAERNRAIAAERNATAIGASMIDNSIQAWVNETDQAEAAYEAAMGAGDYRTAAKAQTRISDARYTLGRLQEEKQSAEARARQPRQETVPQPQPRQAPDGRAAAESIAANLTRDNYPKSAEWIRSHPELLHDQKSINRVSSAHGYVADVLGLVPETDAYFAKLEETLGMGAAPARAADPDPEPVTRQSQRAQPRAAAIPSARASQSVPSLSGVSRRQSVTLTPEQREHAHNVLGMTDEEYAAELVSDRVQDKLIGGRR